MPEGDTVRNAAARIGPLLRGATVAAAESRWPRVAQGLEGCRILSVEPIGKHLLIELDDDTTLRIHLGMKGSWRASPAAKAPKLSLGRVSLRLDTEAHTVICTEAPTVDRFRTRERTSHPVLSALGPDVLADDFTPPVDRMRASPAKTVAELLLDQHVACGIGNVYKVEVLFLERVHPFALPDELRDASLAKLYQRAHKLMRANLTPGPRDTIRMGRGRDRHWVYGRSGKPCLRCGTRLDARRHGGEQPRTTVWCPQCQPPRR